MLRKSAVFCSYQRGGWSPGSKHQKHMTMNPTTYLYRFPGPHGPGPYTMKYWWTLGCFPTGMDVPFRLNEFLATYQMQHVPLEVEEWLQCFVKDPVVELHDAVSNLLRCMENCPGIEASRGYQALEVSIAPLLKHLQKFSTQLGLVIPPVGVRAVLNSDRLRERAIDDLYEYKMVLTEGGSTPHRRAARRGLELPYLESEPVPTLEAPPKDAISDSLGSAVGLVASPPPTTASDERKLIHLLTTFAEGCVIKERYDDAYSLLCGTLSFAHDDDTMSAIHANVSVAALMNGQFNEAEYHGREAALLQGHPKTSAGTGSRGHTLWATAVAFQDDFERAERILCDALTTFPENAELLHLREQIQRIQRVKQDEGGDAVGHFKARGPRSHLKSQQSKGILHGSGMSFDNEFDWITFKNKLYPSKMNPASNEMGSVFRRVGDLGGPISTSRSMERL